MTTPQSQSLIAVEEHFVTDEYWTRTASLHALAGEGDELAWTKAIMSDASMHARLTDVQVRLAEMNDELAELTSRYDGRFAGLAALAPQDPDAAAAEIVRARTTLGLSGVLIGSHTAGHYLDEAVNEPILAALAETDSTLYLHPRMPSPQMLDPFRPYGLEQAFWGFQAEASTHALRLVMSGALDRHPGLRIVLGHLGEGIPFWLWRLDNLQKKMFARGKDQLGMVELELAPSEYFLRNFWVTTSGMFDPLALDYCVRKLGAERILFAVDYPYESSEMATSFFAGADLTDEARALIGHLNARRLFGLSPRIARRNA